MSLLYRYLTIFSLLLLPGSLLAFDQYKPFSEDGKFGLKNTETEEVVIAPDYEAVGWSTGKFSVFDGTVAVKRNNKWALVSVEGKNLTQALYTVLYPFTDGLLIAGERSRFSILNKYGLINTKGRTILALKNDRLTPYQDQLIAGELIDGQYQYGLLNKSGKEIIPKEHAAIRPIKEGLYDVNGFDGLSALYSSNGQQLSAFEFEAIEAFDEERLLIKYYNRKGLVDQTGSVIIPPIYKDIHIDRQGITALPFKKWSTWQTESKERDFYFDDMQPLSPDRIAVQANENIGIIDLDENYLAYFTDLKMIDAAHGLVKVSNGTYQGVINAEGKLILAVNYDEVKILEKVIFARINRSNRQNWEVMNHQGKLISRQRYRAFEPLPNGFIKAVRNTKLGILNDEGRETSPFIYDAIGDFKNDMAVVSYLGNVGVIHKSGDWIITPYKDSLAIYDHYIYYRQGSEYGLLDKNDRQLMRTQDRLFPINNDWLIGQNEDGFDVLNTKGESLLNSSVDSLHKVHNDLLCLVNNDKLSLFRPSNRISFRLPANTTLVGNYSEDLIAAQIDGQWGFVNEDGSLAIANRYEDVKPFSEGLAAVKLIGKWGVINKREEIVIQPTYDSIGTFYGGLALVQQGNQFGLSDRSGNTVLDVQYDELKIFPNHILMSSSGLWGLATGKGSLVRAPQYDRIDKVAKGVFRVFKNGRSGIINLKGEDLVPLAYEQIIPFNGGFLGGEPSTWIRPVVK